jgi:hypothetical protein
VDPPPQPPPGSFTQSRASVEVFRAIAPAPRSPRAIEAPPARRRPLAIEAPADPSRSNRVRRVTGERPPWAPARKPNETPAQGQLDPQAANAQLAPWEKSPPDLDALPPAQETPPRPVSTTGPMYIWNPTEPPPALSSARPRIECTSPHFLERWEQTLGNLLAERGTALKRRKDVLRLRGRPLLARASGPASQPGPTGEPGRRPASPRVT